MEGVNMEQGNKTDQADFADLEAMLAETKASEQAAIDEPKKIAQQEKIAAAKVMALKLVAMYEGAIKLKDSRLAVPDEFYSKAEEQLAPAIEKLGIEDMEPPAWLKEWMPYILALWFAGTLSFNTWLQIKALREADEARRQAEQANQNKETKQTENQTKQTEQREPKGGQALDGVDLNHMPRQ